MVRKVRLSDSAESQHRKSQSAQRTAAKFAEKGRDGVDEVSEETVQQEFLIPFRAQDRRVDHFGMPASQRYQRLTHFLNGSLLQRFIAHDSTLAHLRATHFELRLHQDYEAPASALRHIFRESR